MRPTEEQIFEEEEEEEEEDESGGSSDSEDNDSFRNRSRRKTCDCPRIQVDRLDVAETSEDVSSVCSVVGSVSSPKTSEDNSGSAGGSLTGVATTFDISPHLLTKWSGNEVFMPQKNPRH